MDNATEVTPRVDLIARVVCVGLGVLFALIAWLAYINGGPGFAYWACGFAAIVLLVVGSIGPRSFRVGLVSSMPWF